MACPLAVINKVVAAMIMGSLRCLGASVSEIFRPDRQNGFISATGAKTS
ncbi:MAG: hypothetical protein IKD09_04800 [Lentisphaeria bacterium]|nr:hypothetical protein [Lentisphaeria bacterium]